MKKLLTLILTIALALVFVGCSKKTETTKQVVTESPKTKAPVVTTTTEPQTTKKGEYSKLPDVTTDAIAIDLNTIYLEPGVWKADGARFAIYSFESSTGPFEWKSMTDSDGDGIYELLKTEIKYANIIFVRLNGSTSGNSWENKWNQSKDLTIPQDKNMYSITAWETSSDSSKSEGNWNIKEESSVEPIEPVEDKEIYLNPGVWEDPEQSEVYYAWGWQAGQDGKWYTFTSTSGGKFKATVPSNLYGLIIMRASSEMPYGWEKDTNFWNKSADIILGDYTLITITSFGSGEDAVSLGYLDFQQ